MSAVGRAARSPRDSAIRSPRELHRTSVLTRLRHHGRSSRAQLALATGLSRGTVSGLVNELLASGAVVVAPEQRRDPGRGGRPPQQLTLDPAAGVLLGLDFGHSRVLLVAVDAAHDVLGWRRRDYPPGTDWAERCRIALTAAAELKTAADELRGPGGSVLRGCGIGVPGGTQQRADVLATICDAVGVGLAVPVRYDNNARLAGLAESTWGAARGISDVAYLRLSNGVGGAIVLDGKIRKGVGDLGGELGHVCVEVDGPRCRCTKRGCLEARVKLEQVLADAGCASLAELRERVAAGESRPREVVVRAGELVGLVLASVGTALDLRNVVLAGELASLGDVLLDPVRAALRQQLGVGPDTPGVTVAAGELADQAGALGAIALLLHDPDVPIGSS